jgi:hypothetical protein
LPIIPTTTTLLAEPPVPFTVLPAWPVSIRELVSLTTVLIALSVWVRARVQPLLYEFLAPLVLLVACHNHVMRQVAPETPIKV